jgi:putative spermidine/putrescine transport system ATP-binding protein
MTRQGALTDEHIRVADQRAGTAGETLGLELVGVRKLYGEVAAVEHVDLEVRMGEFLTLLGPSGSGKTTTLRLVAGFTQPTSGTIRIAGEDMTLTPPHKRDVGMVFQNYALFPHMSIRENIAYPLRMRKVPRAEQKRLVDEALALVQMDALGDRAPRQLSGGQQQRAALARAIVYRPRILLMDEPLGALDKKLREALQLEIRRLHQTLRMTVLYVTHDQEEALVLSDRIALFNGGRIVQLGGPTELYQRPASVFVADFIGDSNVFRGRLTRSDGRWWLTSGQVRLPAPIPPDDTVTAGSTAAIVVRLEHVDLGIESEVGAADSLAGHIREVIYLGPYVKYEVETAAGPVFARRDLSHSTRLFTTGEAVRVRWLNDRALLVPD